MTNGRLLITSEKYATSCLVKEIKKILDVDADVIESGLVEINVSDIAEGLLKVVLFSETSKRVFLELNRFFIEDFGDIYKNMNSVLWQNYFTEERTFAIRVVDLGFNMDYKKNEIAREAGQGVVDRFKSEKNNRPKVDLSEPDIEIYLFLHGTEAIPAIDLTGFNLNSEEGILSRSLIITSEWDPEKDKLAELLSGGVAQSAWNWGKREPWRKKVSRLSYLKTLLVEQDKILQILKREWTRDIDPKIVCYERPEKAAILKENFRDYRKVALKSLDQWHADEKINLSNLVVAEPSKLKQSEMIDRILEVLEGSDAWERTLLAVRGDLIDKFEELRKINKAIIKNDIVVKGLDTKIVIIER
ncbi:MAG: THUMP domain-containing protein [Candidatus Njordarchaeia archaeon]